MQDFSAFLESNFVKETYRSTLALNGEILTFPLCMKSLPVIAVDGGANQLSSLGIQPDIIIGDLDSLQLELYTKSHIIHTPNQNYCDFAKALDYLKKKELVETIILGLSGGTLDHILQNINIFLTTQSIFYAPPIVGIILQAGIQKTFSLNKNTKISLIGIPAAQITTLGLKWDLTYDNLTFPGKNSFFNRSIQNQMFIKVDKGVCLVMIYLEFIDDDGAH